MTQEEVLDTILSARTIEQIVHARQVLSDWLEEHPNDLKVLSGGEMLAMLAQAHGLEDPDLDTDPGVLIDFNTEEETQIS